MAKREISLIGNIIAAIIGGSIFILFLFLPLIPLSMIVLKFILAIVFGGLGYLAGFLIFGTKSSMEFDLGRMGITDDELKKVVTDGVKKLEIMRKYRDKIKNPNVKQKVSSIIKVVEDIFEDFKKDPQDIKTARQFLTYYLDSTIKIIEKYTDLSSHNIESEKLKLTLEKTESILDTIHKAFEKQLANLLANDVMDLDVEVKVLENTLKSEGLGE